MNPDQAKNRLIATLVGGLLVPRIEEFTHTKLTPEDIAALITLVPLFYHAVSAAFLRYFPPPNPIEPPPAAKVTSS